MKMFFNLNDKCRVKLTYYGAILYNEYKVKYLDDEKRKHYFNKKAVKKDDVVEEKLAYLIAVLKLGTEEHGFSAIAEGPNAGIEVFEVGTEIF